MWLSSWGGETQAGPALKHGLSWANKCGGSEISTDLCSTLHKTQQGLCSCPDTLVWLPLLLTSLCFSLGCAWTSRNSGLELVLGQALSSKDSEKHLGWKSPLRSSTVRIRADILGHHFPLPLPGPKGTPGDQQQVCHQRRWTEPYPTWVIYPKISGMFRLTHKSWSPKCKGWGGARGL